MASGRQIKSPAFHVKDLQFSYGNLKVLDELTLSVSSGEIFGILGANGSGKTTLLRLLMGILRPHVGTIQVLGEEASPNLFNRLGYMPQLQSLYLELSVQQNLDFFARMQGLSDATERQKVIETILTRVELRDRRKDSVNQLSGGMRQRVSLAIALVHNPSLLFLDEPTVGLDPELRASLWEHFRSLASSGSTMVISSHVMDDAEHCDRLGLLHDGKVVAIGSPAEIRASTGVSDSTLEEAFLHLVRQRSDE
jgi:ABC-2 type transport system ATP-binding protein